MSIDNVEDLDPIKQYTASAAQTDFDYTFAIFDNADLVVVVDGVTKALDTDYSVSGAGADTGGTVSFTTPMTGGEIVTIYRSISIERLTDIAQNGKWSSTNYNDEQDKTYLLLQELRRDIRRALRIPLTSGADSGDLELNTVNFENKFVSFDSDGRPVPTLLATTAITQAIIGDVFQPQTLAESDVGVVPLNKEFEEGNALRYIDSSQHAHILNLNYAAQNGTLVSQGIANCLAVTTGRRKRFPYGWYKVTSGLTVLDNGIDIDCDEGTNFFFDDTASPGSFFLTVGETSGTITGFISKNLNVNLLTATAGGIHLINSTGSYWQYTLISGYQPASNWDSRTNIGVKITSTGGNDCFFNVFDYIYLPHCITGVKIPGGGIATMQVFNNFFYFGDSGSGCTTAIAFDIQGGSYSVVNTAFIEQVGSSGFGFRMLNASGGGTTGASGWKVNKVVFDTVTTAVSFASGTEDNKFRDCTLAGAAVSDSSNSNSGNEVLSMNAWDTVSASESNSTTKSRSLGIKHYSTAQSAFEALGMASSSSTNQVTYGGGNTARMAATIHSIYAAANNTTLTGTEVIRLTLALMNIIPPAKFGGSVGDTPKGHFEVAWADPFFSGLAGTSSHADDAAAAAAGVGIGQLYLTGSIVKVRVA